MNFVHVSALFRVKTSTRYLFSYDLKPLMYRLNFSDKSATRTWLLPSFQHYVKFKGVFWFILQSSSNMKFKGTLKSKFCESLSWIYLTFSYGLENKKRRSFFRKFYNIYSDTSSTLESKNICPEHMWMLHTRRTQQANWYFTE